MSLAYGRLFHKWEINLARKLIREYKKRYTFLAKESQEDLLQDCLVYWYYSRNKYDPSKNVSKMVFAATILRRRLNHIARDYLADKRKALQLSEPLEEEELKSQDPREYILKSELKSDIEKAFQKLNPIQLDICRLIIDEGLNPTDIARYLKIDRGTVYYELKLIRRIFEKEGLDEHLR